jgi:hypothetical protein
MPPLVWPLHFGVRRRAKTITRGGSGTNVCKRTRGYIDVPVGSLYPALGGYNSFSTPPHLRHHGSGSVTRAPGFLGTALQGKTEVVTGVMTRSNTAQGRRSDVHESDVWRRCGNKEASASTASVSTEMIHSSHTQYRAQQRALWRRRAAYFGRLRRHTRSESRWSSGHVVPKAGSDP